MAFKGIQGAIHTVWTFLKSPQSLWNTHEWPLTPEIPPEKLLKPLKAPLKYYQTSLKLLGTSSNLPCNLLKLSEMSLKFLETPLKSLITHFKPVIPNPTLSQDSRITSTKHVQFKTSVNFSYSLGISLPYCTSLTSVRDLFSYSPLLNAGVFQLLRLKITTSCSSPAERRRSASNPQSSHFSSTATELLYAAWPPSTRVPTPVLVHRTP